MGRNAPHRERRTENGEQSAPTGRQAKPLYKATQPPSYRSYASYTSYSVVLVGTSIGRAGGAGRTSPCRGVGQRPTSTIFLITQFPRAPARQKSASICVTEGLPSEVTEQSAFSLCVLCALCDVNHSGSPAGGSRPLIGSNLRNRRFPPFVHLRGPSCSSCQPRRANPPLCSLWPWKVWPFGPARSVLCSPGRHSRPSRLARHQELR